MPEYQLQKQICHQLQRAGVNTHLQVQNISRL